MVRFISVALAAFGAAPSPRHPRHPVNPPTPFLLAGFFFQATEKRGLAFPECSLGKAQHRRRCVGTTSFFKHTARLLGLCSGVVQVPSR
jgi:hypothetical protein